MSSIHNIYDAYLYRYKKFILAFTYTPGFDIKYVIDDIAKTFNCQIIKLEGDSILKADSKFNYSKLNSDVKKLLSESDFKIKSNLPGYFGQGILIYGLNIPTKNLDFQIDLHLHFSASINMFLKSNSEPDGKKTYTVDDYKKFKDLLAENKIHKYFNQKVDPSSDLNDSVFEKIIDFLEIKVYGKDYEKYSTKLSKERNQKNNLKPLVNPKPNDVLAISQKNQLANDKRDELLTDVILSSVSDIYDTNDKYPTKKSHTNYHIYKKMAKDSKLSESESNMSDFDLLTGDEYDDLSESDKSNSGSDTDKSNTESDTESDTESETNSDTESETNSDTESDIETNSETLDLYLKDDIELTDSTFIN
jgi:hypothetical protein